MGDSSDEGPNWIFYKDRREWNDVVPLRQDDGEIPVVSIRCSEKFNDVYNYFRAIIASGEKSNRALQLTKDAAELNPANYTVWQYRREILKELNKDLRDELKYSADIIDEHPKNYQVWHHRRVLVEWLNDASGELNLTQMILNQDAKNYHAWQHRQWAIKTFKLFEGELDYIDHLLQEDIRNNSAWNQRYFVINNTTGFTEDVLKREIEYTLGKISIAKENESAWNFLRGLLLHDKGGLSKNKMVTDFCEALYAAENRSPFLLALLVDMCDEQVSQGGNDPVYTLERALALCKDLATEFDTIRVKYWDHMGDTIKRKADGTFEPAQNSSIEVEDS